MELVNQESFNKFMGLEEKLDRLNPPKSNAKADTWAGFYTNNGFLGEEVDLLLEYLEENISSYFELAVALDDANEDMDDGPDINHFPDIVRALHAFRVVMSMGNQEQCVSGMKLYFLMWPFEHFPQISDDVSKATILRHPYLNSCLVEILELGGGRDSNGNCILINTVATAVERVTLNFPEHPDSEDLYKSLASKLDDLLQIHPENALVISMILSSHPRLTMTDAIHIKRAFDIDFVPPFDLNIRRLRFSDHQIKELLLKRPVEQANWHQDAFSPERYSRIISWLGMQGRYEWHQFHMLGCLLNPFSDMGALSYLKGELDSAEMDELTPPYITKGQMKGLEDLFDVFARICLESADDSLVWLKNRIDLEAENTDFTVIRHRTCMASFLAGFDEWNKNIYFEIDNHKTIHRFLTECERFYDCLENQYEAPENEIQPILDKFYDFWKSHFKAFKEACLQEKSVNELPVLKPDNIGYEMIWDMYDY